MPVWRPRPDWLHTAVQSVLDETGCELELIIVDDGNNEPVEGLIDVRRDQRVRFLRVEHCGPYATRNAAMRIARGDYMRFVDSDDAVEPGSTGRLLKLAQQSGEEVLAYGATMMCDSHLNHLRVASETFEGDAARECLLGGFNVYVVSILYPRAVIERAGPWSETGFSVSGDWDFVLRALEQAPVRRLNEIVSYYRWNEASVSRAARTSEGVAAAILVVDRFFERHPNQRGTPLEREAYTKIYLHGARLHLNAGAIGASIRHLLLASQRSPLAGAAAVGRFAMKSFKNR